MTSMVHGTADGRFERVRELLSDQLAAGEELGASIAVELDGEQLVDVWGGYADSARQTPWSENTIVNVWSCTKTVTSLAMLMLVERGLVDVFAPVADYWPEFAANGKEAIEVRHLLSHTSGVSGWEQPFVVEDMYDWELSTARLAEQTPWWEPGTASGYHANNYGHLLGEVLRRVSGKSLKDFVRAEIAEPLGADFQIGASESDDERIAEIIPPPPLPFDLAALPPDDPMLKTMTGPVADASKANTTAWRRADMGGLNGHGNARSLARMLSAISTSGTANGVRLLSPETIELIFQEQADGPDVVLKVPLRWGIGYGLSQPQTIPVIPDEKICFWGGWGGSMIVMHPDRGLTISYVMNRMAPGIIGSDRANAYLAAIYEALG